MANSAQLRNIAYDATWQYRVLHFSTKTALAVMDESEQTANHANRLSLAKKIIAGNANVFPMACAVLTNATIAAMGDPSQATDNDLEYTVTTMYNAFANSAV